MTEDYFKYHNGEKFRDMHRFMVKHGVSSEEEGLERVLNGSVILFSNTVLSMKVLKNI